MFMGIFPHSILKLAFYINILYKMSDIDEQDTLIFQEMCQNVRQYLTESFPMFVDRFSSFCANPNISFAFSECYSDLRGVYSMSQASDADIMYGILLYYLQLSEDPIPYVDSEEEKSEILSHIRSMSPNVRLIEQNISEFETYNGKPPSQRDPIKFISYRVDRKLKILVHYLRNQTIGGNRASRRRFRGSRRRLRRVSRSSRRTNTNRRRKRN
jgi:hypothetical protein